MRRAGMGRWGCAAPCLLFFSLSPPNWPLSCLFCPRTPPPPSHPQVPVPSVARTLQVSFDSSCVLPMFLCHTAAMFSATSPPPLTSVHDSCLHQIGFKGQTWNCINNVYKQICCGALQSSSHSLLLHGLFFNQSACLLILMSPMWLQHGVEALHS